MQAACRVREGASHLLELAIARARQHRCRHHAEPSTHRCRHRPGTSRLPSLPCCIRARRSGPCTERCTLVRPSLKAWCERRQAMPIRLKAHIAKACCACLDQGLLQGRGIERGLTPAERDRACSACIERLHRGRAFDLLVRAKNACVGACVRQRDGDRGGA